MPLRENSIFKKASSYSMRVYISQFISVIGSLVSKFFLGPVQVGIWSALTVVLDLSKYTTLGVTTAMNVEVPYETGRGNVDKVRLIRNQVFSFLLVLSFLSILVVLICGFVLKPNLEPNVFWGVLSLVFIIPLQRFNNLLISLVRAEKDFETAGRQTIYSAIINVFLVSYLSYQFKIFGFLSAVILSLIFNLVYVGFKKRYSFSLCFDKELLGGLVKLGLPLRVLGLMGQLFRSIDKIMILKFLGLQAMGFYSIAVMVSNYLSSLHTSVAVVLAPHFHEKKGQDVPPLELKAFYKESLMAMGTYLPIVIGLAVIGADWLVRIVLKDFIPGLDAMCILTLSIYFLALANLSNTYLVSMRLHWKIFPILIAVCVFSVVLNYGAVKQGWGLEGVALATVVSVLIYFGCMYFQAMRATEISTDDVKDFAELIVFFAYTVGVLYLVRYIANQATWVITIEMFLSCISFGFLCLPFWYKLVTRFGAWEKIKGIIHGKEG